MIGRYLPGGRRPARDPDHQRIRWGAIGRPSRGRRCFRPIPEAVSLALRELAPRRRRRTGASADFLAQASSDGGLAAIHPLRAGRGRSASPRCKAGADPLRGGRRPLRARPLYAAQDRGAATCCRFSRPTLRGSTHWSVCAFGRREAACVTAAALLGGHVRVGFENNLTLPNGAARVHQRGACRRRRAGARRPRIHGAGRRCAARRGREAHALKAAGEGARTPANW